MNIELDFDPTKTMERYYPKNIANIIGGHAKDVGKAKCDHYLERMAQYSDYTDSPIEQLLFASLYAQAEINHIPITYGSFKGQVVDRYSGSFYSELQVHTQIQIGKYRVDFQIKFMHISLESGKNKEKEFKRDIVVECDSQKFHEKTEKERRYEKCRDRYMQKLGKKVFRYTGKEIIENSIEISDEILGYLTGNNYIEPINPYRK